MNDSSYMYRVETAAKLYLPINVGVTLMVDVLLLTRLRALAPPRRCVQGLFLLKLIIVLDLLNLISPATQWINCFLPLNTFSCKVLQFFAREPYTLAEWSCVLFASERASQRLRIARSKFSVLRIKLGFALFALVLGAAYTNYMWMYGLVYGNCIVLPEFEEAYYFYIIYTEPVVEFLMPHFCAILAFVVLIGAAVVVTEEETPFTGDGRSANTWVIFLDIASIIVTLSNCFLEAPKNLVKFISIVIQEPLVGGDLVTIFYMISVGRFSVRGCLILLLLLICKLRQRRLQLT